MEAIAMTLRDKCAQRQLSAQDGSYSFSLQRAVKNATQLRDQSQLDAVG